MKSIVSKGLESKKEEKKRSKIKFFSTSLALVLIVFAFTMSSPNSFFQIVKPAMAAGILTSMDILPTNNIVNTRTTYDIIFKTATTATIKKIEMDFQGSARPVVDTLFDHCCCTRPYKSIGLLRERLSSALSTAQNRPVASGGP